MHLKTPLLVIAFAVLLSACSSPMTVGHQAVSAATTPTATGRKTTSCKAITESEVAALFDRWNASLQTGSAKKVVANYANDSILLPTLSNTPRLDAAGKEDYFIHFLVNKPVGRIDMRHIQIGCNTALDTGLYTFTFAKTGQSVSARYSYAYVWDGKQWLISSHHSSGMPEKAATAPTH